VVPRLTLLLLALSSLAASCSSSASPADAGPGGPVSGSRDTHCALPGGGDGGIVVPRQSACAAPDGGTATSTACAFGATLFGTMGEDDDCKYQVSWSSSPVFQGIDVTFTITVTRLADGTPVSGANTQTEIFLGSPVPSAPCPDQTRPAPNPPTRTTTMERGSSGIYQIGPVRFDAPGDWTVRFHFYEDCYDAPESPHGHAAFLVHVP
jgi:hypothetical protein